jgi:hypothetical protein
MTQNVMRCCLNLMLMQAFGFLWAGPSNHYWQKFLEKLFKGRRDGATVVQKVVLDRHLSIRAALRTPTQFDAVPERRAGPDSLAHSLAGDT